MVFLRLLTGGTRSKTPSSHNVFLLVSPQRVIYNPCPYICFWFKFTKTFLLAPSYTWPHIVFLKGISKRAKNETFYVFTNLYYAPSWWTCPNKTSHGQLTISFCKSVYSWLVDSRPKGKYIQFLKSTKLYPRWCTSRVVFSPLWRGLLSCCGIVVDQEDNGDSGTPPVGPMHPQFPPTMGREQVTIVICLTISTTVITKLMSEKSYIPGGGW